MQNAELYEDTVISVILTPYRKLRGRKRWSLQVAADFLQIGTSTLCAYETKKAAVPKDVIQRMDKIYGCNGKLIDYWWKTDLSTNSNKGGILNRIRIFCNKLKIE